MNLTLSNTALIIRPEGSGWGGEAEGKFGLAITYWRRSAWQWGVRFSLLWGSKRPFARVTTYSCPSVGSAGVVTPMSCVRPMTDDKPGMLSMWARFAAPVCEEGKRIPIIQAIFGKRAQPDYNYPISLRDRQRLSAHAEAFKETGAYNPGMTDEDKAHDAVITKAAEDRFLQRACWRAIDRRVHAKFLADYPGTKFQSYEESLGTIIQAQSDELRRLEIVASRKLRAMAPGATQEDKDSYINVAISKPLYPDVPFFDEAQPESGTLTPT